LLTIAQIFPEESTAIAPGDFTEIAINGDEGLPVPEYSRISLSELSENHPFPDGLAATQMLAELPDPPLLPPPPHAVSPTKEITKRKGTNQKAILEFLFVIGITSF
jgi:hypothetical protein